MKTWLVFMAKDGKGNYMKKKIITLKDYRPVIFWCILGLICYGLIGNFIKNSWLQQREVQHGKMIMPVEKLEKQPEDFISFYNILKNIENDDEQATVSQINSYLPEIKDVYLKSYLDKFLTYITTKKIKERKPIYFFNEMPVFSQYIGSKYNLDNVTASNYAQIIPFHILKKYDRASINTLQLCDIYLRENIKGDSISKNCAILICLKVRRMYETDGLIKSDETLKKIQETIDMYKQMYPNELKDNPSFMDEINWLEKFDDFLTQRINNPVMGIFSRLAFNKNIKGLGE